MFKYKPMTDDELQELVSPLLLPDGDYRFTIRFIEEQVSRSNNPMLKVTIKVHDHKYGERNVVDYLLTNGKMAFKFKHFCNSLNIPYDSGQIDLMKLVSKMGMCKIGKQKGAQKDDGSYYPDKNNVIDYLPHIPVANRVDLSDDIPF